MQLKLILDQIAGRCMANGHEKPFARHFGNGACLDMARFDRLNTTGGISADHLIHLVVPDHLDFRIFEKAILHDLFRTQAIAAVDQCDL